MINKILAMWAIGFAAVAVLLTIAFGPGGASAIGALVLISIAFGSIHWPED